MKDYGYDRSKATQSVERLPKGAYIAKILGVKWEEGTNGNSDYLKFQFDIVEGEYKDFFTNKYKADTREDKKYSGVYILWLPKNDGTERDEKTVRTFNNTIAAFEDSNNGFHFDSVNEQCLKGKTIGAIFRMEQFRKSDGGIGTSTKCFGFCRTDEVRKGTFFVPKDRYLEAPANTSTTSQSNDGFINIPTGVQDELPFA